jgi:hypothetical protein
LSNSEIHLLSEDDVKKYKTDNILATESQQEYFDKLKQGNPIFNKNYLQILPFIEMYKHLQDISRGRKAITFFKYANSTVVRSDFTQDIGTLKKSIKPG